MGELQLLGMTHYPPFGWADECMSSLMHMILSDPDIPAAEKEPSNWPGPMRAEWGTDGGASSAASHRRALIAGLDQVRQALDSFNPDVILVWGDDQYENFREDLIPPFSVLAYADRELKPYEAPQGKRFPSYWDEPNDFSLTVKGRPDIARWLVTELINEGFDVPYAYRPLHDTQLPHAFLNTVLFLDHRRKGFPWPIVCMPINCYGRKVIAAEGSWKPFAENLELDPPSPPPWRLMDVGSAVARNLRRSPWRVSVIASSSWSHAFLTDSTWRLRPDTRADRTLYQALVDADTKTWENYTTEAVELAGQQEVLNWFLLMGAVRELGAAPAWSMFVETWVFNSNKVFAIWDPVI